MRVRERVRRERKPKSPLLVSRSGSRRRRRRHDRATPPRRWNAHRGETGRWAERATPVRKRGSVDRASRADRRATLPVLSGSAFPRPCRSHRDRHHTRSNGLAELFRSRRLRGPVPVHFGQTQDTAKGKPAELHGRRSARASRAALRRLLRGAARARRGSRDGRLRSADARGARQRRPRDGRSGRLTAASGMMATPVPWWRGFSMGRGTCGTGSARCLLSPRSR